MVKSDARPLGSGMDSALDVKHGFYVGPAEPPSIPSLLKMRHWLGRGL